MDQFDHATELEEFARQREIAAALATPKTKPTGYCHYCFEGVGPGSLFCDRDCRDDYEKEQRHARLSGK